MGTLRYSSLDNELAGDRRPSPFITFVLNTGIPKARQLWVQARNTNWPQKRPQTKKKSAEELAIEKANDEILTVEDDWRYIMPGEVREHHEWPAEDVAVMVHGLSADEKEKAKLENWDGKGRLAQGWKIVEDEEIEHGSCS